MRRIYFLLLILFCVGCAGTGFQKRITLMPDEVWVSSDFNPQDNFNSDEITGGLKWKLK